MVLLQLTALTRLKNSSPVSHVVPSIIDFLERAQVTSLFVPLTSQRRPVNRIRDTRPAFLPFRAFAKKFDHLVDGRTGVRLMSRGIRPGPTVITISHNVPGPPDL
ncbi:unnamed protein product [Haemonchus placei]|uniref:PlsC domain-containing protein n=1 Tax=Haemonchus placei TaxID=6290 RepID=A0A0N4VS88_HAEPC|nr:unnamed protein product [Haemonchus placei]